jgi:hypothetical protein
MTKEEFIEIIKDHNRYWNLKRRVIQRLKSNKKRK